MYLFDRVCETSTTTGTGNLTLAGAVAGFQTFNNSGAAGGSDFHYLIEAVDTNGVPTGDWEVGIGTCPTTTTLQRMWILGSSNAGSVVTLAAGTKRVHLIASAYQLKWRGAYAFLSTDQTTKNFTTAAAIAWDGTNPDTDSTSGTGTGFWVVGTPNELLIPSTGYDQTIATLFGQVGLSLETAAEWVELTIKTSGSVIARQRHHLTTTAATFQIQSPIVTLGAADTCQLFVQTQTDASVTVVAADTFFQLDIRQ